MDRPVHPRPTAPPRPLYAPCMAARTRPSRRILRPPEPRTLRDQVVLEEHDVAADGSFAVVSRRTVDGERYVSDLWLRPARRRRAATAHERREPRQAAPRSPRTATGSRSPARSRAATTPCSCSSTSRAASRAVLALGDLSPGELAWSPDSRTLAFTAETGPRAVPRRPEAEGRRAAARTARHDDRLPLGRGGLPRPPVAAVRRRRARGRRAAPAHDDRGRRGRHRVAPGLAGDRLRGRPAAGRGPHAADLDLGGRGGTGRRRRRPRAARDPRAPRAGQPTRVLARLRAHRGRRRGRPELLRRPVPHPVRRPRGRVGARRSRSPRPRPAGRPAGRTRTSPAGWSTARPGPAWDGEAIVALVTDRGRTHPWRVLGRPDDGPADGRAGAASRAATSCRSRSRWARGRRRPSSRRSGPARLELCVVDSDGTLRPVGRRWAPRGSTASPGRRCRSSRRPGAGGPIETWIASPAGAGDAALPTIVDVHGGPLGAWAPRPIARGRAALRRPATGWCCRTSAARRRTAATGSGRSSATGAASTPTTSTPRSTTSSGSASRTPSGSASLGLSYGGFMVNWLVGTTDRFRAAVSENGVTNQVAAWAN